jgi:3-methyladenine DNA glycosylase AlkC
MSPRMAPSLKRFFNAGVVDRIAAMIAAVHPRFPARAFREDACRGLQRLELLDRGRHIARALHKHLPPRYEDAIAVLVRSLGKELNGTDGFGMAPFLYLPHVDFVEMYGADHFEPSMRAQHALTRRFSAEGSIRVFLERHPARTLARLRAWAKDPSEHVRRLVSEGTRPRLPWARRLRDFQRDPRPVLRLLELLKDDPSPYVRRSVANNLNDIGKDHPALLVETCRRWMKGATEERRRLVRHALRQAVKRGDRDALALLGFSGDADVELSRVRFSPPRPRIGFAVEVSFALTSRAGLRAAVDLAVHFAGARGNARRRVFKLRAVTLAKDSAETFRKRISLAQLTTRRHYPGAHRAFVLVNGAALPLGAFEVVR